ncbi:MAG TPA: hypothetical protein VKV15_19590, partial [Bryobacteraceae bacterium]|nr:hypothetical protein [Bryobacteraceae bacterium]
NASTNGCISLAFGAATGYGDQYTTATFTAPAGSTLASYAIACALDHFNWQQMITTLPCPSPFKAAASAVGRANFCSDGSLTASPATAFADPPFGGYTVPSTYLGYNPFPFYYPSNSLAPGGSCTVGMFGPSLCPPAGQGPFVFPDIIDPLDTTLSFIDDPNDPCLPGGSHASQLLFCGGASAPLGSFFGFSTALVGVDSLGNATPLYSWTWISTFNGTAGSTAQTASIYPIDPGSGTGGVTITSINGVPLAVVSSTQISTTASGLAYSRVSQTFNGTVKITNVSGSPIRAPSNGFFQILFMSLPAGVTLSNATGTFNRSPFITIPAVASLAPGQSVAVIVQFKNPSNAAIKFTPVIYSGSFN